MTVRPRSLVGAVAAASAAVTLGVSAAPWLRFAYQAPKTHVFLETAEAVVGFLAAYLIFGRYLQSRLRDDLILVYALVLLASANLVLSALPRALVGARAETFSTWAPVAVRLLGAAALAYSASVTHPLVCSVRRAVASLVLSWAGTAVLVGVGLVALSGRLPRAVDLGPSPETASFPRLVGHPAVLVAQLLGTAFFAVAAVSFTRRAERTGDEFVCFLAAASTLSAFAHLNYFLFPSLYSEYVYTGDFFRLGFYVLLLVGSAREIGSYWRRLANEAVLEERRRMARDLHDGLAQELAFITSQTRTLLEQDGRRSPDLEHVATAAERALDESRRAIAALTRPVDEPLDVAIADTAEQVAGRYGARVRLHLDEGVEVEAATREALLRIVREAITNAVRHGKASAIDVHLSGNPSGGGRLGVRIRDDGSGFDLEAVRQEECGFGLLSMAERAQALGATFRVASEVGRGTEVDVVLP